MAEPGGPRVVLWCNRAAQRKFGRPRSVEEVWEWWRVLDVRYRPAASGALKEIYRKVQASTPKAYPQKMLAQGLFGHHFLQSDALALTETCLASFHHAYHNVELTDRDATSCKESLAAPMLEKCAVAGAVEHQHGGVQHSLMLYQHQNNGVSTPFETLRSCA